MYRFPQLFRTSNIIKYTLRLCVLLLLMTMNSFAAGQQATNDGSIIVTLKPLYSLVAHLTDGIEAPGLLIKQTPSSHHYTIRPSQRRALANARLIIWFGPQMESYLSKIIEQPENSTTFVVSAMQAEQLKLLDKRRKHSRENADHATSIDNSKPQMTDPHIWLSTANATAISKHIAEALITYDPKNTASYNKNLQRLLSRIEQTKSFIETTLDSNSISDRPPFIAYHDAFQYFEDENRLNYIDSISYDEETGPGLKHLRQIKSLIDEKNIQCLVYQAPKPAIVDSLTAQTSIKATALDPLGINVSNDKEAWFELMKQLATDFKQCLKR